jgi:hypothetical protein
LAKREGLFVDNISVPITTDESGTQVASTVDHRQENVADIHRLIPLCFSFLLAIEQEISVGQ